MALQQQRQDRPPAYSSDIEALKLPSGVAPISDDHHAATSSLPDTKIPTLEPLPTMVTSPAKNTIYTSPDQASAQFTPQTYQAIAGSALQSFNLPSVPSKEPGDVTSNADDLRRDQSASMEDPDDRMAAEALCGLGKVGMFFKPISLSEDAQRAHAPLRQTLHGQS